MARDLKVSVRRQIDRLRKLPSKLHIYQLVMVDSRGQYMVGVDVGGTHGHA